MNGALAHILKERSLARYCSCSFRVQTLSHSHYSGFKYFYFHSRVLPLALLIKDGELKEGLGVVDEIISCLFLIYFTKFNPFNPQIRCTYLIGMDAGVLSRFGRSKPKGLDSMLPYLIRSIPRSVVLNIQ
jgi:hypothetical protein